MNVAVMKTKAEQAISEGFEVVADALPGGAGVREVRKAALGRFGALGLPHRRIEEWKYTDLKTALKDVARPAVGDATPVTIADVIVALGPFARLELPRLVLVNGGYRKDLSNLEGLETIEVKPLSAAVARGRVEGVLEFDARRPVPVAIVRLTLAGLKVESAPTGRQPAMTGQISGRIDLRSSGADI